jgi:hypothetical protein
MTNRKGNEESEKEEKGGQMYTYGKEMEKE